MQAHVKSDKKGRTENLSDKFAETKILGSVWFDSLGVSGGKGRIKGEIRQLMEKSLKWKELECLRQRSL